MSQVIRTTAIGHTVSARELRSGGPPDRDQCDLIKLPSGAASSAFSLNPRVRQARYATTRGRHQRCGHANVLVARYELTETRLPLIRSPAGSVEPALEKANAPLMVARNDGHVRH
eukprot:3883512-Prymnesium_polylepis.1